MHTPTHRAPNYKRSIFSAALLGIAFMAAIDEIHHSLEEIRAGAKIMYYGGDFAELLLVIALFAGRLSRVPISPRPYSRCDR